MSADRRTPSARDRRGAPSRPEGIALGTGIGLDRPWPDRKALLGSLGFHAVVIAALAISGVLEAHDMPEFQTFRVKLYSPPPQVPGPPMVQPVATQNIVQAPVVENPIATPKPQEPVVRRTEQTPVAETKPKDPQPVTGARPDPASTGGENIDIDIEGQEFPFGDYLENIILQINRYFRGWSGDSNPEAQIAFFIARDGSVGGLRVVRKSGDWRFDIQTMDAVTQAGRRGAFGPLPDGWLQDRLWVRFTFIPPGS